MAEKRHRRTKEETLEAFEQATKMIADGTQITEALEKVAMASSVFARYKKGYRPRSDGDTRAAKRASNPKKGSRRTMVEVDGLVKAAKRLADEGMTVSEACKQVGIPTSNYYRHVEERKRGNKRPLSKRADGLRRMNGSMRVSALPPRPKKGQKQPKRINPNDVGQVAHRISILDRKISRMQPMQMERRRLAQRLLAMLKNSV